MQGIHSIVIHSKLCMFSFLVYSIKLFNITYFIAYGADNATRELPDLYNLQMLIASAYVTGFYQPISFQHSFLILFTLNLSLPTYHYKLIIN